MPSASTSSSAVCGGCGETVEDDLNQSASCPEWWSEHCSSWEVGHSLPCECCQILGTAPSALLRVQERAFLNHYRKRNKLSIIKSEICIQQLDGTWHVL
jgi:hypothetical protein